MHCDRAIEAIDINIDFTAPFHDHRVQLPGFIGPTSSPHTLHLFAHIYLTPIGFYNPATVTEFFESVRVSQFCFVLFCS